MRSVVPRVLSIGFMVIFMAIGSVWASASRTAVSVHGDDANAATNCTPATPCRTFAVALGQTTAGGEVVALDTGGFGTFTITQGVTITAAPGAYAAAQASSGTAVVINAAGASVVLRGLTLNGVNGGGFYGIDTQAVGSLHLESCVIEGFNSSAIRAVVEGSYFVKDTLIRNDGYGVYSTSATTNPSLVEIDSCRIEASTYDGVLTGANGKITVRNSVINGSGIAGIQSNLGPCEIIAEHVQVSYNATGVWSTCALCAVVISGSQITENTTGVATSSGGILKSMGNNFLKFNTSADGSLGAPLARQ